MATLVPAPYSALRLDAGLYRELDVLEHLRAGLPEGFTVFHSLPLHHLNGEHEHHGEVDIVVLAPNGSLLLAEVKAGQLVQRNGELFKLYRDKDCNVAWQSRMSHGAMMARLREARLQARVLSCLILPDYHLEDAPPLSFPRERIIAAGDYAGMCTQIRHWLSAAHAQADLPALERMLRNEFRVIADVGVLREQLAGAVRQLADGLATWAPRITAPSGILHIHGTAGSGKTQLALRLAEDAATQAVRAAYICFNRGLADRVRELAPARTDVATFHELCTDHYRRSVGEPDFGSGKAFAMMEEAYLAACEAMAPRYDVLVIDEAQDFNAGWLAALCRQLKPDGKLYVMEDENQRLYRQEGFELEGAVRIDCNDNFRSPRAICNVINAFGLCSPTVRAAAPYDGEVPPFRRYGNEAELLEQTRRAIDALLAQGFALQDIAIVAGCGRERSILLAQDCIGPYRLRRFTGRYGRNGEPVWTEGDVLAESVYRFKGLSAPAVIAAEFDFEALDDMSRRKLFVALSRAQLAAAVILSEGAEKVLAAMLD